MLKAGAQVSGTVIAARKQGRFKGEGDLGIELTRVGSYGITTQEYEQSVKGKGKRTGAMVGGGAGGGALIGGIAGGGKGALIGGLVGAGAGTAGAVFTGNKAVTIPAESVVNFCFVFAYHRDPNAQAGGGVAANQSLRTHRGDPQSHLQTSILRDDRQRSVSEWSTRQQTVECKRGQT